MGGLFDASSPKQVLEIFFTASLFYLFYKQGMLLFYFANDEVGNTIVVWEAADSAAAYFRVNYLEVFLRSVNEYV